jgi:EmrB/QacA subfamily drug resistance transporter
MGTVTPAVRGTAAGVLVTLMAAQFLMTLDSSVMNVSMATVANDLGTTITGIQTAITLYTLVMASLMIAGGKIGSIIGRRRAFAVGCVIYGSGSLVTGLAPSLPVMIFGWSLLEGAGAALIMPAVVALVAGNFGAGDRSRIYGLIAAAGAIAVAVGPLIGGAASTYASWRLVFFAEVVLVGVVLVLSRRMADVPVEPNVRLDVVGMVLSVVGLGSFVFGVLRSSEWGWVSPKADGPALLGISATLWLMLTGLGVAWLFVMWQRHMETSGREPLVHLDMFANRQLTGGLMMFGFQFMLQAGVFFVIPLFLSVVLELSAIDTGIRLMPLSLALLVSASGVPKLWPQASPRRVTRVGMLLLVAGIITLMSGIDLDAPAAVVLIPMLLLGLGIGALASQLGSVTVSAVSPSKVGEVGGLQNTATNLGASLGTALAGSLMIAVLTSSIIAGIQNNDAVPDAVAESATTEMVTGVPFLSDSALQQDLADAGVDEAVAAAVVEENRAARVAGLDAALGVLALIAMTSLLFTGTIPTTQPADDEPTGDEAEIART